MNRSKPVMSSNYAMYSVFILGLLASTAFRVIIVIDHIHPSWVRPVWYFAVLGNFYFFFHRFRITVKRKKAVDDYQLIEKAKSGACLSGEDREVLVYLLSSIKRSPENINYLIIFLLSLVAIGADIILTYIG